ncbi:hypothetical protein J2S74_005404 [Evansella vedderi]|uniref:Uncharacterized protein n=2 Tax=Evansella vedderi TaxID=38282 RepID=A0ABU0A372_9BACI|nr:hypothetical protein [Evansella vedderi]
MQITLNLPGGTKTFTSPVPTVKTYDSFLKMRKKVNVANVGENPRELKRLIKFITKEVFKNQFTVRQFYQGVPLNELALVCLEAINEIDAHAAGLDVKMGG